MDVSVQRLLMPSFCEKIGNLYALVLSVCVCVCLTDCVGGSDCVQPAACLQWTFPSAALHRM